MSEQNIALLTLTKAATAAIILNRFITHAGAVPAAGAAVLGVAKSGAAIGERVPVDVLGTAVVESGGAVAVGAAIEVDNLGRGITKNTGVTVGRALQAAGAAGELIEVLLVSH